MTKNSSLSKSSVTLIALALLLVVSIALTATLALFWDARRAQTTLTFSSGVVLEVQGIDNGTDAHMRTDDGNWSYSVDGGTAWLNDGGMSEVDTTSVKLANVGVRVFRGAAADPASVTVRVAVQIKIDFGVTGAIPTAVTQARFENQRNAVAATPLATEWLISSANAYDETVISTSTVFYFTYFAEKKFETNAGSYINIFNNALDIFVAGTDDANDWAGAIVTATVVIKALKTADAATGTNWDFAGYTFSGA